jgi:hypothetical protein
VTCSNEAVVGKRQESAETLSRLAPAGDSKVGGASQDTTRSVEKPLGVVDDKSKCEMTFWQKKSKEEIVLKNSHYEKFSTYRCLYLG